MESLGEFLKLERESRNISLEEIASKTRISLNILKAIENDDVENLPGEAFVKGFLKAYSKYLNLEEEEVILRFENFYKREEPVEEEYKRELIEDFFEKKSNKSVIYILMIIVVLFIAYSLYLKMFPQYTVTVETKKKKIKVEEPDTDVFVIEKKEAKKETDINEKSDKKPIKKKKLPVVVEKKYPPINEELETEVLPDMPKPVEKKKISRKKVLKAGEGHRLIFRSDGIVWMQIQIDDEDPYEVTLHADEVYKISAEEQFKLKIGDAGKVQLEFDGEELGYIGDEKQVKRVTLPKPGE